MPFTQMVRIPYRSFDPHAVYMALTRYALQWSNRTGQSPDNPDPFLVPTGAGLEFGSAVLRSDRQDFVGLFRYTHGVLYRNNGSIRLDSFFRFCRALRVAPIQILIKPQIYVTDDSKREILVSLEALWT